MYRWVFNLVFFLLPLISYGKATDHPSSDVCRGMLRAVDSAQELNELKRPFVERLLTEGLDHRSAEQNIDDVFLKSLQSLGTYFPQPEIEKQIAHDDGIAASAAARFLPALVALGESRFDPRSWMMRVLSVGHSNTYSLKDHFRYSDLWFSELSDREKLYAINRLIALNPQLTAKYLSLYFDNLARILSDSPEIFSVVIDHMTAHSTHLTAAHFQDFSELPVRLQAVIEQWTHLDDTPIVSDAIRPLKYCSEYAGICPKMKAGHLQSFGFKPGGEKGGLVLISVQGELIGSMKMNGDHSIVALRNVKNTSGRYAMIIGGVYNTSHEITRAAVLAARDQGNWARLNLKSLSVRPLQFLSFRENAEDSRRWADELIRIRRIHSTLPDGSLSLPVSNR